MVLTGADVDAVAGLLHLRERQAFTLYGSDRVLGVLKANPIFNVLSDECVRRETVPLAQAFEPRHVDGSGSGLTVELFAVPGKVALSLERLVAAELAGEAGDTIGVAIGPTASDLLLRPGCAGMTPTSRDRLRGAPTVLFDGTLWRDDEMVAAGARRRRPAGAWGI